MERDLDAVRIRGRVPEPQLEGAQLPERGRPAGLCVSSADNPGHLVLCLPARLALDSGGAAADRGDRSRVFRRV